ncbi:MAG: hypothetical protein L0K30_04980, partial [Acidipropionibacterium jensenii]|nr:hypothetical protein [Acidipropionibacterium jensenii]
MTTLSRRNFLFATLAASATAAAGTVLGSEPALAVDRAGEFTRAAARYDVPAAVLATVSYGQSRWEDHAGSPSAGGGYGPMHLVDGARAAPAPPAPAQTPPPGGGPPRPAPPPARA